jgi:hypothetical protein
MDIDSSDEDENRGKYCSVLQTTRRKNVVDDRDILKQNPYCPLSPFLLQTSREVALVDSGANISLLSKAIVQKLSLKINPFSPHQTNKVTLADNNESNLLGMTDEIEVKYNGRTIKHAFNVIEQMSDNIEAIFGCDIFPKLGIALTGVAYNWDDNKIIFDDSVVDKRYEPNVSKAGTDEEQAAFMATIKPSCERNKAIEIKELCPNPLALIKLETKPDQVAYRRQYPIADKLMPVYDKAVAEWLENGVVVDAKPSPWNNPVTFCSKVKDGITKHRTCLDVRLLNSILVPTSGDSYSIRTPTELFKQASGCTIYTCLDLSAAYMRCPIRKEDQVKLTFQYRNRSLMFRSCPFGIKFVGSSYTRLIDSIIGDLDYANSYIDDIYIFTKENDMKLHAQQVKTVIDRLTDNKLILNFDKAHFAKTSIVVLGQIISKQGRSLCTKRLTNIMDLPPPQTGKELQRALGVFNYMRDHAPNMSRVTWRLDALRNIGDKAKIDWTPQLMADFQAVKDILASNVVLSPPDYSLPFEVAVDGSAHAIGSCLYQKEIIEQAPTNANDQPTTITKIRYIGFHSRALSKSEQRWPSHRREMQSLLMALKVYDQFLHLRHFTVYTDCRSLTYLFTQTPINMHFAQYFDTFLSFSFDLIHVPGLLNVLPDQLSRLYPSENDIEQEGEGNYNRPNRKRFMLKKSDIQTSFKPMHIEKFNEKKREEKRVAYLQSDHKFSDSNYIVVPEADRKQLLKETHEASGHFGADNIVKMIKNQNLMFPNMLQAAIDCVSSCSTCTKFNIKKRGYSPMKSYWAHLPGDGYVLDLAGPFRSSSNIYSYVLVMVDVCTRFCILKPLVDKTAKVVCAAMIEAFSIVGLPRFFVASDNGTEFSNELHESLFQSMDIEKRYSTVYHPSGNGIAERSVQIMKRTLAKLIDGCTEDWSLYLPITQLLINNRVSKALQSTPFSLFFARDMNAPITYTDKEGNIQRKEYLTHDEMLKRIDYMSQIVFPAIAERQKMVNDLRKGKVDKKNIQVNFKKGSYVMARVRDRQNALSPAYDGPYQVVRQNEGNAYILRDEEGMLISRNFIAEELKSISQDSVVPRSELYEIEAIIDDNGNSRNREYLVKWKNYNKEHNSWVKSRDFTDPDLINAYWRRVKTDRDGKVVKEVENKKKKGNKNKKLTADIYQPSELYNQVMEIPTQAIISSHVSQNLGNKHASDTRNMNSNKIQISNKRKFGQTHIAHTIPPNVRRSNRNK